MKFKRLKIQRGRTRLSFLKRLATVIVVAYATWTGLVETQLSLYDLVLLVALLLGVPEKELQKEFKDGD